METEECVESEARGQRGREMQFRVQCDLSAHATGWQELREEDLEATDFSHHIKCGLCQFWTSRDVKIMFKQKDQDTGAFYVTKKGALPQQDT